MNDHNRFNRRIVVDISGRYFLNSYLNYLMKTSINVGLFLFLMQSIDMAIYERTLDIIFFSLLFTIIEELASHYIHRSFGRYILLSFGTIMIFAVIFAMSVAYYIVSNAIIFHTMDTFFGFVVVFMIVRKTLSIILMFYINHKRIQKILEKEVNKDV